MPRGPWSLPRPGPWTAPDREAHAGRTGSRPAPVSSLRELRPRRPLHPGVGCGCGALAWGRPSALLGPHGVSAGQVPVSLHFHCQSLDLLSDQCHGGPFCLRRKAPRYLPSLPSLSLGPQQRAVAALGPRGTTAPEEGTSCGGGRACTLNSSRCCFPMSAHTPSGRRHRSPLPPRARPWAPPPASHHLPSASCPPASGCRAPAPARCPHPRPRRRPC